MRTLLCVIVSLSLSNCATLFNSRTTDITIVTEPEGLQVSEIGKGTLCKTPCTHTFTNHDKHHLTISGADVKPFHRTLRRKPSGWFWANFGFVYLCWIPMAIDFMTRSVHKIKERDDKIFVQFNQDEEDVGESSEPKPKKEEEPPPQPEIDDEIIEPEADQPKRMPTWVETLPPPTPSEMTKIEEHLPQSGISESIRHYYGDFGEAQEQIIRKRLYKILAHQLRSAGELNIDQAITLDFHESNP